MHHPLHSSQTKNLQPLLTGHAFSPVASFAALLWMLSRALTSFLYCAAENHLFWPAGSAVFNAPQNAVLAVRAHCFLTLSCCHEHPRVPPCWATSQPLISQSASVWHLLHPRCSTQHFSLLNFMPLLITPCSNLSRSRKKEKGKRCFYCSSLHSLLTDLWAYQYSLKRWSPGNIQGAARQELLAEGECIQPRGARWAWGTERVGQCVHEANVEFLWKDLVTRK